MVEGHGCHRVAHFHRQKLLNRSFKASSPNGRFTEGAAAINNQPLTRIEVHGKNLFYFFGTGDSQVILHFHFGMSGAFSVHTPPHDTKPTTRLELFNEEENIVAHLSAMTVQHGDLDFYNTKIKTLGEDPLRENADAEVVWSKISSSKKPIGLLLMDQSVIAGIGNIYRAEILFKSGVHPEQPGYTISKPTFDVIWQHSVDLLQRGFQSGSILTVDPEEAALLGSPWTRRYVYNHRTCGRCGTAVLSWDMAARTVYCCTTCQPLVAGTGGGVDGAAVRTPSKQSKNKKNSTPIRKKTEGAEVDTLNGASGSGGDNELVSILPAARVKAMAAARQVIEFVSHCAPDDVNDADTPLSKLTVAALRKRVEAAGILAAGVAKNKKKGELVALLEQYSEGKATEMQGKKAEEKEQDDLEDAAAVIKTPIPASKRKKPSSPSSEDAPPATVPSSLSNATKTIVELEAKNKKNKKVKPGTSGLVGRVATAREAALEKARAGEGRNVEHVALHDDEEERVIRKINGADGEIRAAGRKRKS